MLQSWRPQKETQTKVFSCEICKIFKNAFFCRKPPMTASDNQNVHRVSKFVFGPTWLHVEVGILFTRFTNLCNPKSRLLLYDYNTILFYFVCSIALALFICGHVELNLGPKNTFFYNFSLSLESPEVYLECSRTSTMGLFCENR